MAWKEIHIKLKSLKAEFLMYLELNTRKKEIVKKKEMKLRAEN